MPILFKVVIVFVLILFSINTFATIAAYHSVVNEHLKGLEALNLQSEEIKPLIAKYKNKIGADNEIIKAAVELGKKPSTEAQDKLSEVTSQSKKIEDECANLQNELVDKFPIEE